MIINGREIAKKILDNLTTRVEKLKKEGITPTLAIILVGDNPQSIAYIEQKELKANKIGAKVIVKRLLKAGTSEAELLSLLSKLSSDQNIHGIIVQRPVEGINPDELDNSVDPTKDVDGFNPKTKFDFPIGRALLKILEYVYSSNNNSDQFVDFLRRSQIVLIGKGQTGGYPIIRTFEKLQVPFNVIDTKTSNPKFLLKNADIVISAVGKPETVKPETLKIGVILISVGLSKGNDGKMRGDYDEEKIKDIASFYTPTPGGVGPVNVACLLENLVKAAENSQ